MGIAFRNSGTKFQIMKFFLSLISLLGICQTQSTAEFEYELEIELRNLTLYALENNIAEEHLDQFIEYAEKQNDPQSAQKYFCYQWLIFTRQQRNLNTEIQLCLDETTTPGSDLIPCQNPEDCPVTSNCKFTACKLDITNVTVDSTAYTISTSLINKFEKSASNKEFNQVKDDLNADLLESIEKLEKRDHYDLVEHISLSATSFYCKGCEEPIEIEENDEPIEEPSEEEIGPVVATFDFQNRITVTKELETETISEMQDKLQHVHHIAGQMGVTLQPEQAASSVLFEFDGSSYQIKWQFRGEFELTTEAELNEIGQAIQASCDTETSEFVSSNLEITELSEPTEFEITTQSFDPTSCSGSKIQYDINVDAYIASDANVHGVMDEVCSTCLKTAPHISIHDLVDIGCTHTEKDGFWLINYGFNHQKPSSEYPDATLDRYTSVLLEQSSMCIDNMISSGSLLEETSVEVTHTVICGSIVEYKFPTESIVAAVLGSLTGLALVLLTVKLMIDDQKTAFASGIPKIETGNETL